MTQHSHDAAADGSVANDNAQASTPSSTSASTTSSGRPRRRPSAARSHTRAAAAPHAPTTDATTPAAHAAVTATATPSAPTETPKSETETPPRTSGRPRRRAGHRTAPTHPVAETPAAQETPEVAVETAPTTSVVPTTTSKQGKQERQGRRGRQNKQLIIPQTETQPQGEGENVVPILSTPTATAVEPHPPFPAPPTPEPVPAPPLPPEPTPPPPSIEPEATIITLSPADIEALAGTALDEAQGASGQPGTAAAEPPAAPSKYHFNRADRLAALQGETVTPVRPERLSGWRATPPPTHGAAAQHGTATPATTDDMPSAAGEPALLPFGTEPEGDHVDTASEALDQDMRDLGDLSTISASERRIEAEEDGEEEASQAAEDTGPSRRRRRRRRHSTEGETPTTEPQPAPAAEAAAAQPVAEAREPHREAPTRTGRSRRGRSTPSTTEYGQDTQGYAQPTETRTPPEPALTHSEYDGYLTPEAEEEYQTYYPVPRQPETPWNGPEAQARGARGPYGSPVPAYVRGFGPQPNGVATPVHEPLPRTGRTRGERDVDAPPMSANQLGNVITTAMQRQTERLLSELRQQSAPPSMTVMFPPVPSTERVGIFVDVANLVYSARNLHMSLDFGRLLDFLRGNRRLIRAQAYAPTDPDPRADQMFLTAVKGLGYRITTKNYKTFQSGAKKADMDLDLCMDIVRLVDAGAVDTIVLVSGDSDFLPLLEFCSDHGVRVEVAAFEDAASAILRQSCDLFINLSRVDDIRL